MNKILIIQTAFIGDVILATALIEKLHAKYSGSQIDFLLTSGNENLLKEHPFINEIIIWNKKDNKYKNLKNIIFKIRKTRYDYLVNCHRFASSGIVAALSKASIKVGFDKNPLSFTFTKVIKHEIGNGKHEVERNHELIREITDSQPSRPSLYPRKADFEKVAKYKNNQYICIAPTSVWKTKQFPLDRWIEFLNISNTKSKVYLLGAPGDFNDCQYIVEKSANSNITNLCGKLSLLQSAALMKDAQMNFVNDSAPMHIASAMNANVTAIFCSTVPAFGFGPLSDNSVIVETEKKLKCRPCGLHGYNKCPEKHFDCAMTIDILKRIKNK